jgi:hypothetical protein
MTTRGDHARSVQQEDPKGMLPQVAVKGARRVSVRFGNSA